MKFPVAYTLFLIFLLLVSGCSSATPPSSQTPAPSIPIPPSTPTVSFTITNTPAGTPVIPADPIVGSWLCYSNAGGDRLEELYTFLANNTWIRLDRNLDDRTIQYSHGTWKNGGNNQYLMQFSRSSGTFQYDRVKDQFFDTFYKCAFYRTADTGNSPKPAPVINLTLNSEQKVSRLQNRSPFSDNRFLIVNVTIRNIHESEVYSLDEKGIQVRSDDTMGSYSITGKMEEVLDNPLPFGLIAPGETRQGIVLFSVPKDSRSYTLRLANSRGDDASNIIIFKNTTAG